MKPFPGILAAVAFFVVSAARVEAQDVIYGGYDGAATVGTTYVVSSPADYAGPIYPYSYWAAYPFPARGYVGPSDYAYYGRPYGHPYDPWTWAYMDSSGGILNRYYYPPVR